MKRRFLLVLFLVLFFEFCFTVTACNKKTNPTTKEQTTLTDDKESTTKEPVSSADKESETTEKQGLPEGTIALDSVPTGLVNLEATVDNMTARAEMSFEYKESTLDFVAYVLDEVVYTKGNIYSNDNIELALDKVIRVQGYTDSSVSVVVDASGNMNVRGLLSQEVLSDSGVTSEAKLFTLDNETVAGYMVKISVPYTLIGVTKEEYNAAVLIALTNAQSATKLNIELRKVNGEDYESVNTYARIKEDGTLEENPFSQLGLVWGNAEKLSMASSWDITHDDGTEGAYIEMTSSDGDNNIYMHHSNALEEYVEVKLNVKQLLNGEKWGKFGLVARSKDGNRGFFYYVDAASADGENFNAQSVDLGYNTYNGEGSWSSSWGTIGTLGGDSSQYQGENYVTLGIYRSGSIFALYANGTLVKYLSCDLGALEEAYFGLVAFNMTLRAKEYKVQKDNLDEYKVQAKDTDYLFIGDSYIDTAFWYNFGNAFGELNAVNAGVGGTKIGYWTSQIVALSVLYSPKNIIVHIGVNDIDDEGISGTDALARLENMLNKYHEAFPEANIYYADVCHNMMFKNKWSDYDVYNAGVSALAEELSYLTVIKMSEVITADENGSTMRWYGADGLHYGIDGYAAFTKEVMEALGLEFELEGAKGDVNTENAPELVHSPGWEIVTEDDETVYHNAGRSFNRIGAESQFFFNGLYSNTFYAEAKISLEECYCPTDEWAKTGLAIRSASGTYFFFINSSTVTNPERIDGSVHYTDNWGNVLYRAEEVNRNWTKEVFPYLSFGTPGYDHKFDKSYMTLGIARDGKRLAFYANGRLVASLEDSNLTEDELAAISVFTFNMNVYAKDLTFTTDRIEVLSKFPAHKVVLPTETPALKVTSDVLEQTEGKTVTLTVEVKEGITVEEVTVNGTVLTLTEGKYTFEMPGEDVTVSVKISGSVLVVQDALRTGLTLSNDDPAEGDTVVVTVKDGFIVKSLLLNGTDLIAKENGTYEFKFEGYMELTGEVLLPADQIKVDLELETELYGTPDHFYVEGGRDVSVYAAKGTNGVYFYVLAHTLNYVNDQPNWFDNHNIEFKINQDRQMFLSVDGQSGLIKEKMIQVTKLEEGEFAGKYEHRYEFFVAKEEIKDWSIDGDLEFGYAYKAIGEQVSHENQSSYNWMDNYWQTTVSAINARQMVFGEGEVHPGATFITQTGLRFVNKKVTPEHATIDGNLEEFESKASVLLGDDKSKFLLSAFTQNDGLYIGIKVYSKAISTDVPDWWLNDNIELKYNGRLFGITIYDKFVAHSYGTTTATAKRIELTSGEFFDQGYTYETDIEWFIPGLGAGEMEFSSNGNGFRSGSWIGLAWDGNTIHVDENGLRKARTITIPEATTLATPSVSKTKAFAGETVEFTLALSNGVAVTEVKANDQVLTLTDGKYTFTMPDQNVSITYTLDTLLDATQITDYVTLSNENPAQGDTLVVTPKGNWIIKSLKNGETELTVKENGTVEIVLTGKTVLTGEFVLPADAITIDGVKDELYTTSDHFYVEGGRDVRVFARQGAKGVYILTIAHTNANVNDQEEWHANHDLEFKLNGVQHYISNNGLFNGITEKFYSSTLLDSGEFSGKYEHVYEMFIAADQIANYNPNTPVELAYAYKAVGEVARHEGMSDNEWYDQFWQTTTSALNARKVFFGKGESHPGYLYIDQNGLDNRSPKSSEITFDGNLNEYEGKASIVLGNDKAKFHITGYTSEEGLHLVFTIYQCMLAAPTADWWTNDNIEIKFGVNGTPIGFSLFDKFVVTKYYTQVSMNRTELTSGEFFDAGYRYQTVVEYFLPNVGDGTIQFGCNGNGFQGWQALLWDGNFGYVDSTGIYSNQDHYVIPEGLTLDGELNEELWTEEIKSKAFTAEAQGSRITARGFMIGNSAAVLAITVEHNKADSVSIQGDGSQWWNYSGPELRLNYQGTQLAVTTWNKTAIGNLRFNYKTVENAEGSDYAYTTTYEIYLPGASQGDCALVIGGVYDNGFSWLFNDSNPAFNITKTGLVKIY